MYSTVENSENNRFKSSNVFSLSQSYWETDLNSVNENLKL